MSVKELGRVFLNIIILIHCICTYANSSAVAGLLFFCSRQSFAMYCIRSRGCSNFPRIAGYIFLTESASGLASRIFPVSWGEPLKLTISYNIHNILYFLTQILVLARSCKHNRRLCSKSMLFRQVRLGLSHLGGPTTRRRRQHRRTQWSLRH